MIINYNNFLKKIMDNKKLLVVTLRESYVNFSKKFYSPKSSKNNIYKYNNIDLVNLNILIDINYSINLFHYTNIHTDLNLLDKVFSKYQNVFIYYRTPLTLCIFIYNLLKINSLLYNKYNIFINFIPLHFKIISDPLINILYNDILINTHELFDNNIINYRLLKYNIEYNTVINRWYNKYSMYDKLLNGLMNEQCKFYIIDKCILTYNLELKEINNNFVFVEKNKKYTLNKIVQDFFSFKNDRIKYI